MAGNNRLTWKDVSAPNFSAAGEMAKNASNMIQQAIGGVGAGLEGFDDFQKQQAANYLARQTSQFTNPEELQAALASGALFGGADPTKFSAGDLSKVNSRVNSLLDQENTRISTLNNRQLGERNQSDWQAKQDDKDWFTANSDLINQAKLKAGAGGATAMNAALAAIPGVTPTRLNQILNGNMEYASEANKLSMAIGQGDQQARQWGIQNAQFDGAQAAGRLYQGLSSSGALDNTDGLGPVRVKAALANISDPYQRDAFIKMLPGEYQNIFAPQTQALFTAPTGKAASSGTPSFNVPAGGMSKAVADSIFTQESSGGKADTTKINSQNVTGPMQIMESTFDGMKKNGIIPTNYDWRNPEHNKDAGYKLVDYYGKKYNNDPAKMAAAYYGGEGAVNADGTINRDWKNKKRPQDPTVGEYVDSVVGRVSKAYPAAPNQAVASLASAATNTPPLTRDGIRNATELNQINADVAKLGINNLGARILAAKATSDALVKENKADPSSVATVAVGKGGPFEGMDKSELINHIRDVQTEGDITATEALEILKDSQTDRWNTNWKIPVPWGENKPAIDKNRLNTVTNELFGKDRKYQKIVQDQAFAQQGLNSTTRDITEWAKYDEDRAAKRAEIAKLPRITAEQLAQFDAETEATRAAGLQPAFGNAAKVQSGFGVPFGTGAAAEQKRADVVQQELTNAAKKSEAKTKIAEDFATNPNKVFTPTEMAAMMQTGEFDERRKLADAVQATAKAKAEIAKLQTRIEKYKTAVVSDNTRNKDVAALQKKIDKLKADHNI